MGFPMLVMASALRDKPAEPKDQHPTLPTQQERPSGPGLDLLPGAGASASLPGLALVRRAAARVRGRWALRAADAARKAGGDVKRTDRSFRLNGLRWHHMAISRDLRRFSAHVEAYDCGRATPDSLAELHEIYSFFFRKVWKTYNKLENDVLFPWICEGGKNAKGHADLVRAVDAFSSERDRIEANATNLENRLDRLARKGKTTRAAARISNMCSAEMKRTVMDLQDLLEDTERLHGMEQDVLFPYVARQFTKDQQRSITNKIVYMMDPPLAKLNLVSFHEALKTKLSTRADWRAYEKEVPTPVRLYLWVWKGRLWDPSPLARLDPTVTNPLTKKERRRKAKESKLKKTSSSEESTASPSG